MTRTLGELLKHRHIKQVDVWDTLTSKYGIPINRSCFNRMCHKEEWFSRNAKRIQECIKHEYGIYYDGSVWRGGI